MAKKKDADVQEISMDKTPPKTSAKAESKAEAKAESVPSKIQVVGPNDVSNGAAVLRFQRDGRKKAIDITKGQILTVGEEDADITADEAQKLLNYSRWEVKEVKEGEE